MYDLQYVLVPPEKSVTSETLINETPTTIYLLAFNVAGTPPPCQTEPVIKDPFE
jgi:hypothetical protein